MITDEEYISILSSHNFWGKNIDTGISRNFYTDKIIKFLNGINIVTESGIRRSGKSFISMQAALLLIKNGYAPEDILIINFDDERLENDIKTLDNIYNAYKKLIKKTENNIIIIDEAQEVPGWEKFVRTYSEKAKFIITGSSSKLLSSEFSTLLSGRNININVTPLSFIEYLRFNNIIIKDRKDLAINLENILKYLELYIKFGGMPAPTLHKDIHQELIKSYFDTIILKDIMDRYKIREGDKLKFLIKYYLTNISSLITFNNIYKSVKDILLLPVKSIQRYSEYIETSGLIFFTKKFSYSLKEQENSPKKVYSIDNSFSYYFGYNFMENKGRFIENTVAQEFMRLKNIIPLLEIYYYREKGYEIDFIIKIKNTITPVQVSYLINENNMKREVKGLIDFSKKFNARSGIIVNSNIVEEKSYDGIKVKFVKLHDWLINSKEYLEYYEEN
ncbi:MAG: ATP-binding protein [Ferroplasma sp.]|uniref:ATP-binding protein n=1 Tax=Ferroplasma sp. TaxID=2591003 RepID=UPI0028161198|nr:ATP-binding protein [Ferroplasma sp.]WMT50587.1 MAG: ATP-binding protein [Ferroplasma sp.]